MHRRRLAALLAVALMASLVAAPAAAVESGTCPTPVDPSPPRTYRDVPLASVHADSINCVTIWGIAQGRQDPAFTPRLLFEPGRNVNRAQMATFVAGLIRSTGTSLPDGPDRFRDDDGSPHERNINALAAVGVVSGLADGSYGPNRELTRGQAATLLTGAHRYVRGQQLASGPDRFRDDDGSPHEDSINRLVHAGVIQGLADGTFGVGRPLRRDQMASLLARSLFPVNGGVAPGTPFGTGTIHVSSGDGALLAVDPAGPTRRTIGTADQTTRYGVDPVRGELHHTSGSTVFTAHLDGSGSPTSTVWSGEAGVRPAPSTIGPPAASPVDDWLLAATHYAGIEDPDRMELRTRDGQLHFNAVVGNLPAAAWFADGALLVVERSGGSWTLGRADRAAVAAASGGRLETTVLSTLPGDAPAALAIAPDQRHVAYAQGTSLYVQELHTGRRHRIARADRPLTHPAFSPDGRHVLVRYVIRDATTNLPASGAMHRVPVHQQSNPVELRVAGATVAHVRAGGRALAFDSDGPVTWAR